MKERSLGQWRDTLLTLVQRYKYVLLVILAGAALLLLPSPKGEESQPSPAPAETGGDFQVEDLERRMEEALSRVAGAGEVKVVLTVQSTARRVLAQDGRSTQRGEELDSTLTTVVVAQGSGTQEPVTIQQLSPQYQGALVVCSGGDDPSVRLRVVEAVSALTGLGADKISVCKGK